MGQCRHQFTCRNTNRNISTRQVATLVKRSSRLAEKKAVKSSIRPIVEFYPIDKSESQQSVRWEILPSDSVEYPLQYELRTYLEKLQGIYFFYDSGGRIIYTGKTEAQSLWKEMNSAFNRERQAHKVFKVKHPTNVDSFKPAWEKLRQPRSRVVYLYQTAKFFSVYEAAPGLIGNLEAMIIRAFCNDVSNVKMEKFNY